MVTRCTAFCTLVLCTRRVCARPLGRWAVILSPTLTVADASSTRVLAVAWRMRPPMRCPASRLSATRMIFPGAHSTPSSPTLKATLRVSR